MCLKRERLWVQAAVLAYHQQGSPCVTRTGPARTPRLTKRHLCCSNLAGVLAWSKTTDDADHSRSATAHARGHTRLSQLMSST